jgi:ATP-dependent protease ClpP protease subunit
MSKKIKCCDGDCEEFESVEEAGSGELFQVENVFYFYANIDSSTAAILNKSLRAFYLQSMHSMLSTGLSNPHAIIRINSMGGELISSLAIVNTIEELKKGIEPFNIPMKITTYNDGQATSGASLIFISGSERICARQSLALLHQAFGGTEGNSADIKKYMKSMDTQSKQMKEIYEKYTKLKGKELDDILDKEVYLTSDECLKYGICDKIV